MWWFALLVVLMAAPSARAQDDLTEQEVLGAYCHGVASAQVVSYELIATRPCGSAEHQSECTKLKAEAEALLTSSRIELQKANDFLASRGLIGNSQSIGARGPRASDIVRNASRLGAGEMLSCANLSSPALPKPSGTTPQENCERIQRCVYFRPS